MDREAGVPLSVMSNRVSSLITAVLAFKPAVSSKIGFVVGLGRATAMHILVL